MSKPQNEALTQSMTRQQQKLEERHIVESYIKKMGIEGQLKEGPDPPDLILNSGGESIGIEVTTYHTQNRTNAGYTRRQVEAAWEKIRTHVAKLRENDHKLDNLSIHLFFKELSCPQTSEIDPFVEAVIVEIVNHQGKISDKSFEILIDASSSAILQKYLRKIYVRRVNCYIEWDWNHSAGGIGTTDEEMLSIIQEKLKYEPNPELDKNWLIISGGAMVSEITGIWFPFQLSVLARFNKALSDGPYDEVAIFCVKSFRWTRHQGWSEI